MTTIRYFLILLLITSEIRSQHYPHITLWTRVQYVKNLDKNWVSASTVLWRRQNGFQDYNVLSRPLLTGFQTQFSRLNKSGDMLFHVAQITLMYSDQLLGKETDYAVPQNREWRWASGVEFIQNPNKRLNFRERFLQEIRFFKSNNDKPVGRVRGRIIGTYKLNFYVSVLGLSEVVIHDPPQTTGLTPSFRYNQFWIGGGLVWKLNKHLNLEISYTFINTRRNSKIEFDDQNVFNFFLTIR